MSTSNSERYNLRSQKSRAVEKVCLDKSQKKRKVVKPKEDRDDIVFRKFPAVEKLSRRYALQALSYLREKGDNLELVKPGLYGAATISGGVIFHLNFKAKKADDPSDPVKMFFAQVFMTRYTEKPEVRVECCVCLGESDTLPMERDNRGCLYCSDGVYHPVDGCEGMKTGQSLKQLSKEYL